MSALIQRATAACGSTQPVLLKAVSAPIVFITHTWGGGIETYLDFKRTELDQRGVPYINVIVRDKSFISVETSENPYLFLPNLSAIDLRLDFDFVCDLLTSLQNRRCCMSIASRGSTGCITRRYSASLKSLEYPITILRTITLRLAAFTIMTRPDLVYRGLPSWQELESWSRMSEPGSIDICSTDERRRGLYWLSAERRSSRVSEHCRVARFRNLLFRL